MLSSKQYVFLALQVNENVEMNQAEMRMMQCIRMLR